MKFDDIDIAIMKSLIMNARVNMSELAKELGITKNVLSIRWKKIRQSGVLTNPTIHVDLKKFGYGVLANMGIYVIPSKIDELMKYLGTLEGVDWFYPTIGTFDVFVWLSLKDLQQLHEVKNMIRKHPAVIDVKALVRLSLDRHILKYENLELKHLRRS